MKGYFERAHFKVFNNVMVILGPLNPLRPNNDLSQTSHCNIKGLSVSEVMRIELINKESG